MPRAADAPQRRSRGRRTLHGRSRAKLALAEALARLVRAPRDRAGGSGGAVERGHAAPLRSRVRDANRMRARVRVRAAGMHGYVRWHAHAGMYA
jgi:hypothetical protein